VSVWLTPLLWPGSEKPSFIYVNLLSDVCHASIPFPVTRLAFQTIAASTCCGGSAGNALNQRRISAFGDINVKPRHVRFWG